MRTYITVKKNIKQLLKFGLVGTIGFIVDAGALTLFIHIWPNPYLGRIVSFLLAVCCTWLLNRNYTFKTHKSCLILNEWLKYLTVNSFGAGLNYGIYALLIFKIDLVAQWPVLGVAAGSLAGLFANYYNSKFFVFRKKENFFTSL
jgi:putative flippase GtrA